MLSRKNGKMKTLFGLPLHDPVDDHGAEQDGDHHRKTHQDGLIDPGP